MAHLPFLFQLQNELNMSLVSQNYPSSLFLISLFLLSLLLLFIRSAKSSVKLSLPPSPPGLPIIGNLHQLRTSFHHSLKKLTDKYGPLMLMHMGPTPVLVVSSIEFAKELLKNHDISISNRPPNKATKILFYGANNMGSSPYGKYWKEAKKIVSQELLSLKRVRQFQFVREEEVAISVERIRRSCLSANPVINLSEVMFATVNSIICRCVTGQSSADKGEVAELVKKVMIQATSEFGIGDVIPWLSWIDVLTGFNTRLKSTAREMDAFLDQAIKDREALIKCADHDFDSIYLVDVLLRLQNNGEYDFEFTQDNVKAFLLEMFVGGTDNPSFVLEWLMAELMRNPKVMKKAQEEIRRVVGKKPKIDMNDINKMNYLRCIIKEIFRLHPTGPLLGREISDDIKIGGYHVCAKSRLFISAWEMQRDPRIWEKPEEFIPERFENNQVDFKGHDFELIPFGVGRRGCPGIAYGVASVEYVIANLLYWFDWKLPGGDNASPAELDMSEGYGIVVHKKVPLHLVPIPYSP